ncbi:hypothetical protein HYW17_02590 [Candidatus Uhrbacteria bacterium]|nr:hypothetical protein [Candidatus Uhrbacteria bacterium]
MEGMPMPEVRRETKHFQVLARHPVPGTSEVIAIEIREFLDRAGRLIRGAAITIRSGGWFTVGLFDRACGSGDASNRAVYLYSAPDGGMWVLFKRPTVPALLSLSAAQVEAIADTLDNLEQRGAIGRAA